MSWHPPKKVLSCSQPEYTKGLILVPQLSHAICDGCVFATGASAKYECPRDSDAGLKCIGLIYLEDTEENRVEAVRRRLGVS